MPSAPAFLAVSALLLASCCLADDPYSTHEFVVSYKTLSPLGVPQQVIVVNDQFPGPVINVTTNYNVVVNVRNHLDEELLLTWAGIQMRRSSWQDGVLGTNCPIPPRWNWTYQFQVKDQIGSFYYFPSLNFQKASGGYGGFIINNRAIISVPFPQPDGDIVIMIGDWYIRNHTALRKTLNGGQLLGMPDGVLINGKGPYRYNDTLVPAGIDHETINVDPGKTYRIRVHNVGLSTSLNFRIQGHNLLMAETEGTYTVMTNFTSIDIHVGQSYSFLLYTDQNASTDYYIVASARFVNESEWTRVTGVGVLHYSNSKGKAAGLLPDPPSDQYDKTYSMNQARSIRTNGSASGARPNPQGSFHYGGINVTDFYLIKNEPPVRIDGILRTSLNRLSFTNPKTPIRLADWFDIKGNHKADFPNKPLTSAPKADTSIINGTYKGFMEIVLQNNDTKVQSYHLDGYAFFVVGMDFGDWTENSRGQYNKWDGIVRSTVQVINRYFKSGHSCGQVYPGAWTAILISLDNVGIWNLRTENLDYWHLGQETYIKVVNPDLSATNKTENPLPDNVLYCGALAHKQVPQAAASMVASSPFLLLFTAMITAFILNL